MCGDNSSLEDSVLKRLVQTLVLKIVKCCAFYKQSLLKYILNRVDVWHNVVVTWKSFSLLPRQQYM